MHKVQEVRPKLLGRTDGSGNLRLPPTIVNLCEDEIELAECATGEEVWQQRKLAALNVELHHDA